MFSAGSVRAFTAQKPLVLQSEKVKAKEVTSSSATNDDDDDRLFFPPSSRANLFAFGSLFRFLTLESPEEKKQSAPFPLGPSVCSCSPRGN